MKKDELRPEYDLEFKGPNRFAKRLEGNRSIFLEMSNEIGKKLDALGVTDEEIDRDFAAFKKRRQS